MQYSFQHKKAIAVMLLCAVTGATLLSGCSMQRGLIAYETNAEADYSSMNYAGKNDIDRAKDQRGPDPQLNKDFASQNGVNEAAFGVMAQGTQKGFANVYARFGLEQATAELIKSEVEKEAANVRMSYDIPGAIAAGSKKLEALLAEQSESFNAYRQQAEADYESAQQTQKN